MKLLVFNLVFIAVCIHLFSLETIEASEHLFLKISEKYRMVNKNTRNPFIFKSGHLFTNVSFTMRLSNNFLLAEEVPGFPDTSNTSIFCPFFPEKYRLIR